jgi:hypothetical protein
VLTAHFLFETSFIEVTSTAKQPPVKKRADRIRSVKEKTLHPLNPANCCLSASLKLVLEAASCSHIACACKVAGHDVIGTRTLSRSSIAPSCRSSSWVVCAQRVARESTYQPSHLTLGAECRASVRTGQHASRRLTAENTIRLIESD